METTQLYIELIIIGLETICWMCVCIINIIGILMDRFADMIFQKGENKIRNASGLKAKSIFLVWKEHDAQKYSDYSRSKIRILRASIINMPLITISILWYILKYFEKPFVLAIYILFLGLLFTYVSWKSYNLSVKRYYDKACALEASKERTG